MFTLQNNAPAINTETLRYQLQAAARMGTDALKNKWGSLTSPEQHAMEPELQKFKNSALQADAMPSDPMNRGEMQQ